MEAPAVKHLLVLTTIHDPDDPRVRERTLASLAEVFAVDYATRAPGPSRRDDHTWIELRGNRIRRWFIGLRLMLSGAYDVVSIHDPELIPAALIARLLRRRIVVMDVHEHVPGQILHKDWVWRPLRRPVAWVAHRFLRLAERFLVVTLAEGGYQVLFKKERPVFANYPAEGALPEPADDGGYLAYVGVVNEYRGATLMVEAAGAMESPLPLVIVGRVTPSGGDGDGSGRNRRPGTDGRRPQQPLVPAHQVVGVPRHGGSAGGFPAAGHRTGHGGPRGGPVGHPG